MTTNHLVLTGRILRLRQFDSPAGIAHWVLSLEHKSQQKIADLCRPIYCQIQVILSGGCFKPIADKLKIGMNIEVQGFIALQQGRNGQNRLVVHADNVELKT